MHRESPFGKVTEMFSLMLPNPMPITVNVSPPFIFNSVLGLITVTSSGILIGGTPDAILRGPLEPSTITL